MFSGKNGVKSITIDDRYWILDASGKNGATYEKIAAVSD